MSLNSWSGKLYNFLFAPGQNEDMLAYPNLPLCGSFAPILLVNIAYISFVFKIGPWLMKNREPFKLKKVMMFYNLLQVIICTGLLIVGSYYLFFTNLFEISCIRKLPTSHPLKNVEVSIIYIGYLSKYLDYFDTVFFVLRKSYRQITFLHVYHHLIMTSGPYAYVRSYGFGGHPMGGAIINVFVHIIMYSYYFVSIARPELKQSLWWKRHITELQMLQFVIGFVHQMWPIVVRTDCEFPRFWLIVANTNVFAFLVLFLRFYKKTYLNKSADNAVSKGNQVKKTL